MMSDSEEAVTVAVVFSRGSIRPVWFSRKGKQVRIREIALTWKTREGNAPLYHFSVTDGLGLYEICYNAASLTWRLDNAEEFITK